MGSLSSCCASVSFIILENVDKSPGIFSMNLETDFSLPTHLVDTNLESLRSFLLNHFKISCLLLDWLKKLIESVMILIVAMKSGIFKANLVKESS